MNLYTPFCALMADAILKLKFGNGIRRMSGLQVRRPSRSACWAISSGFGKSPNVKIAAQAALPRDPGLKGGFLVPPTLLTRRPAGEYEMFGPVATVTPFSTDKAAISIVNESDTG
ncbi:hypothetical protein N7468_006983 [Penicillium chermesinum]|uniref:Aldehyde dehydrogenase domain-containing protein n=1 Tax=Penicillium chermesinum TaxID=63820 RepID=A0A9W9NVM4_9EURO|nr:uncharacterized protein N7468_006983 [Penicillium chermesinum]KAJ5225758.1 hypothetical protein N7468_006983 [Penicillium chermesinum]